jgi:peptide/nickel transport system substrate-binding protein
MKKILSWAFTILLVVLGLRACINKDIPEEYSQANYDTTVKNIIYPAKNKNVTIDNIDYLQSQAPVGQFGGELIISTIGEGPKTFNPCNTRDSTSSAMAGVLYDGLLTTNPTTGEVEPLLAKNFEVRGNEYTIHLRDGIQWTDGTPITVDDVLYTYWEVVFKGFAATKGIINYDAFGAKSYKGETHCHTVVIVGLNKFRLRGSGVYGYAVISVFNTNSHAGKFINNCL